jgi:cytochrome c-type biogenesis protein CcmH
VKAYRVAATRRPDDPHLWGNLGEALTLSAGGVVTPEAKSLLERLATSGAEDPRAEYYLGVAEAQAGDEHAAIERWRKLLAGSPADADWRPQVEEAVRRAGRALGIDAEAILASARGTAPPPPDDAARIAALPPDARDEQIRAMVARLEARLQERGGDAEGWQKLGRARRVLGEAEASRQAFAKAYTLAPDNPAVIADYAQSLLGPADPRTKMPAVSDDAAKLFERAAELQPDDPGPHWFMGIRALQQGQIVEARSQWSQVLALLGPNHPEYAGIKSLLDAIDAKAPAASTTGG